MKNYIKNWNDFLDKAVTLMMDDPIKVDNDLFLVEFIVFLSQD